MNWETHAKDNSGETLRETASILQGIKALESILVDIAESVGIATSALYGPTPEMSDGTGGPRPVPSGFLAETIEGLDALRAKAKRIDVTARRLRNL